MKTREFMLIGILTAIVFWFADSSVHFFLYGEEAFELWPDDLNELWMRLTISGLIVVAGFLVDRYADKMHEEEKQREANRIYQATLFASHHILNNLLNQMQLFRREARRSSDFDPRILAHYDEAFDEARALLKQLSSVERIDSQSIEQSIKDSLGQGTEEKKEAADAARGA